MFLIDTSAWILSFRKQNPYRLSQSFKPAEVCIALPIYQEVLQGFKIDTDFFAAKASLDNAIFIENPMEQNLFAESAQLYRFLRKKGATLRSGVDVLIAVCAMRNRVTVVHKDRDFKNIARFTDLSQKEI